MTSSPTQAFRKTRILVTGGAGFVGSHLVRRLVEEGAEVHLFIQRQSSPQRLHGLERKLTIHRGNLAHATDVRACLRRARPEIIFNVAGMRERDRGFDMLGPSLDTNLIGTLNLCKTVHAESLPLRAFVQTGSCEEYGSGPVPFREEQREQPVSPYSAGKTAATHFCQMLHRSAGFPVVVLRPCLLYGPAQDSDFFIPNLIRACLTGRPEFPMTSGVQARDLIYVGDMVEAFLLAARTDEAIGEVINIGSSRAHKIKDVAARIARMMGSPIRLAIGALPERTQEIRRLVCSNDKAAKLLGWTPKVDLRQGLQRTIESYRHGT